MKGKAGGKRVCFFLFAPSSHCFFLPTHISAHPSTPLLLACCCLSSNLLFLYTMQPVFQQVILLLFHYRWIHQALDFGNKLLIIVALYFRRIIFKFRYSFLFNHPACSSWKHNSMIFPVSWDLFDCISKEVCRINSM